MAAPRRSYVDHVTCPICLDLLYSPRALPCMHTFCVECLNSYITSDVNTKDEKGFECPVCKNYTKPPFEGMHPYSWADNFPLNFALSGLVDEMKAKMKRNRDSKNERTGIALVDMSGKTCTFHSDRMIEFECMDHGTSICSVCAALFHRKCEQLIFLGKHERDMGKLELSTKNCSESSPLNDRKKQKTEIKLSRCVDMKEETIPKSKDIRVVANDFAQVRRIDEKRNKDETFPKYIEQLENDVNQRVDLEKMNDQSITTIKEAFPRICIENLEDGEDSIHALSLPAIPNNQRTNFCHQTRTKRVTIQPVIHGVKIQIPPMSRLPDILEEDEENVSDSVDKDISKSHFTLMKKINVRIQCDFKCCSVTAICSLPDGRVLVADEANVNVKLFDITGQYEAYVKLESEPWGITAIEQYEAAVSCPTSKCIHILLISDFLTISKTINLNKSCYGLIYYSGEIYIAMENEVRIITCEGKVVQTITSESTRKKLFPLPLSISKSMFKGAKYISLNIDQKNVKILVSDLSKSCVTSINRQCQVLSVLRFGEDGVPYGVSFGTEGEFYVCQAPNKLIAIKSDEHGNRIKTVIKLDAIKAVHVHTTSKLLLVSRREHNFVMIYNVRKISV